MEIMDGMDESGLEEERGMGEKIMKPRTGKVNLDLRMCTV
jgi:hypothetical protein